MRLKEDCPDCRKFEAERDALRKELIRDRQWMRDILDAPAGFQVPSVILRGAQNRIRGVDKALGKEEA